MTGETARTALFGTSEETTAGMPVEIGPLKCLLDGETIRAISWYGTEVVRAVAWPVRDQSWITLPQTVESESLDIRDGVARHQITFSIVDGALQCGLVATLAATGNVSVELTMTATRDFRTNRAGFTLLHPVEGVAGEKLDILHADGTLEHSEFPRLIAPAQPAMDIAGLRHEVAGVTVDIAFGGEVFEMEDQRNWTDASYKTYCRPLVVPFTYTIAQGETIRQTIAITLQGGDHDSTPAEALPLKLKANGTLPQIALAVEPGWLPDSDGLDLIARTGIGSLQVRIGTAIDNGFLAEASRLAAAIEASVDMEVVVPGAADPQRHLTKVAEALNSAKLEPATILVIPEAYLMSHQPSGPWPDGPSPTDCIEAARAVFGAARIGGGVLTNFTEFNRCRPNPAACDFVGHGTTAIVHAADDRSVCETLEALPFVFASVQHLGEGKPHRLGLVSIGMRSNPYGANVAENPTQIRQTMAKHDPRQCGIFAAAFAVGALDATLGSAVETIALAAPAGPFGILSRPQPVPRAHFDEHTDAVVYPIFHVVRAAAAMAGRMRLDLSDLPDGLCGFATGLTDAWDMVLANVSDRPVRLALPQPAAIRSLDTAAFADAVRDPDWLDNAEPSMSDEVEIDPYTVVFASAGGSAG